MNRSPHGSGRNHAGPRSSHSRPSSATSSRKVSPLLFAKKASPMLGTHPVLPYTSTPGAPSTPRAEALTLPDSTAADTTTTTSLPRGSGVANEVELLYNVSEAPLAARASGAQGRRSRQSTNKDDGRDSGSEEEEKGKALQTERTEGKKARAGAAPEEGETTKRRRLEKKRHASANDATLHAGDKDGEETKAADPVVVRSELDSLFSLFSRVEFQLDMSKAPLQQQRSALFPRDIGSLLLWTVPSPIPLIESPRIFMIKNKSRLRDCVVIYVNGWSYDMMMCTGVGIKHPHHPQHSKQVAVDAGVDKRTAHEEPTPTGTSEKAGSSADANESDDEEVWNETICNALLQPIRCNTCWARQPDVKEGGTAGGVQYAPLFIPNMKNTLEQDLFWRNDAPRMPRDNATASRRQAPLDSDVVDVNRVNTTQEEARGVGSALRRAREIVSNTSSPVTAQPARSDGQGPLPETKTMEHAAQEAKAKQQQQQEQEQEREQQQPLWSDRTLLEQYALRLPEHRVAFEELGFTLSVPEVPATQEEGATTASVPDPAWDQFNAPAGGVNADASPRSPRVFAFDCEMVLTGTRESQLARATLLNVRTGAVAFDMLVKPADPVTNYLTRFSGIDEDMLKDVTTTLKDCQAALKQFIDTDTFVVGHSLENDFKACKMLPNCWVLDSSWLFPHPSGLPYKNSLKFLAMRYLGRKIQQGSHDSNIDAVSSADLVYLKMERGPSFGVRERVSVLGLMTATPTPTSIAVASPEGEKEEGKDTETAPPTHAAPADVSNEGGVAIQLFDDAQVLTTMMPNPRSSHSNNNKAEGAATNGEVASNNHSGSGQGPRMNVGAINAIPVRHDEDATRKIVRALQRRQQLHKEQDGKKEAKGNFSFMWVQLTETRDVDVVMHVPKSITAPPAAGASPSASTHKGPGSLRGKPPHVAKKLSAKEAEEEAWRAQARQRLEEEEAEQLRRVAAVNGRVMRIVEACPEETLVIVLAGDCSVGRDPADATASTGSSDKRWVCSNQYSQAQGAAFFFIKDSTAPGPPPPPQAEVVADPPVRANAEAASEAAINLNGPACQSQ